MKVYCPDVSRTECVKTAADELYELSKLQASLDCVSFRG